ncbi:MAG: hypothetical protein QXX94_00965 [Candidatus Bathyarchaeia archaeon]
MKSRPKIAVATVSGKAYYKLVNELKSKGISFISLVPGEPIPQSIEVVLTTDSEKSLINHQQIITYDPETDPSNIVNNALRIIMSKNFYEELIIGVDPGKTFGIAVLADGKILRREEFSNIEEAIDTVFVELKRTPSKTQIIRIGKGVSNLAEEFTRRLEKSLPENVVIEMVDETGTSTLKNAGFKRKISDADSAIKIASKKGEVRLRSVADETKC